MKKEIVSEEKNKPVLDEETLAKLLEAAYVLQEHNRELQEMELGLDLKRDRLETADRLEAEERLASAARAEAPGDAGSKPPETQPAANADYTFTLAQIVGTQHQIQVRHLELEPAMALVADRLAQIARASGAAIAILDDKLDEKLDEKDEKQDEKQDGKNLDDRNDGNESGKKVRYRAVAGNLTLPAGTEVPMEKALCLACLRTGQVLRCADVAPEFLLDTEECRRRGIQSLIAVPIFHDGGVAGGVELYYPRTQAFTEQDVHSCQLMAGLVTEALARDREVAVKKSLASERAVMLDALEKLKPNLAALVDPALVDHSPAGHSPAGHSPVDHSPVDQPAAPDSGALSGAPASAASASTIVCRKCGHEIVGEEQFCGKCGSPRIFSYEAPSVQSREASLRNLQAAMQQGAMQQAKKRHSPTARPHPEHSRPELSLEPGNDPPAPVESIRGQAGANPGRENFEKSLADALEEAMPDLFAAAEPLAGPSPPEALSAKPSESPKSGGPRGRAEFEDSILADLEIPRAAADELPPGMPEPPAKALAKPERGAAWSSAATARDFLEQQLAQAKRPGSLARFWSTRRGDIYLAIAVILMAVVIRWGIWSSHSVGATGNTAAAAASHRKPAPESDLSMLDRMLIGLGLAEPPAAPESKGNPETQVWIDLHTALYYCPGADLYGKTPKGKFATQRDAQLDQFEPAYRKACE